MARTLNPASTPVTRAHVPKEVILDLDGTLVNSNDAQAMAWMEAMREAGFRRASFERLRPLIGLPAPALLAQAVGVAAETDVGRMIIDRRRQIFARRYLPGVGPTVGARLLLEKMHRQGLRLILATTAGDDEAARLIKVAGVGPLLDDAVTGNDLSRSSNGGDVLRVALERCRSDRANVVMVADTPFDVEAGRKARIRVVALRCGGWADSTLEGAVAIFNNPGDLHDRYARSPFFPIAFGHYASPLPAGEPAARLSHA